VRHSQLYELAFDCGVEAALATDQGTGGEVDVVANVDLGGICKDGAGQDAAIRAERVQVAVAAEKFGVFFGTGIAEFGVEAGELAAWHGKVAEDFLNG
jgi:hypothetical protein